MAENDQRPTGRSQEERKEASERSAPKPGVVYEAILEEGQSELGRKASSLLFSALAAGMSMGFSLVTEGLLRAHLPDTEWRPLIGKLGYPIGFLIVVLGRQQLFTENTLTVVLPLLSGECKLKEMLRLWSIVLVFNVIGALAVGWVIGSSSVFDEHVRNTFVDIAREATGQSFGTVLLRGIFAGWLIALMVWLLPAAETARVGVIILVTYVIGIGGFAHIIAGSVDQFVLVTTGKLSVAEFFTGFFLPALIGNVLGGVSLVAALNHGAAGRESQEA